MYLFSVGKEARSFKKTLKSFDKLSAKIRKRSITSIPGSKLRKIVLLIFVGLVLVSILLPPFRFPVKGDISSGFFFRRQPESYFALDLEVHKGIDFAAPVGSPVVASAPGLVIETGVSNTYGNFIRIRHLLGLETRYAHLNEITTRKGALVFLRTLNPIGEVGSTGRSTGSHLHFEVRWFGVALPPRFILVFHGLRKALLRF